MSGAEPRAIDPARSETDAIEASLRPQTLAEFVGQRQLRGNLRVFIDAARGRVMRPERVVAPIKVKDGRSIRTERAAGPSPMMRSS